MPAEVRLHPEAEFELRAAFLWYLDRNVLVAEAFQAEVSRAIKVVAENPDRWPELTESLRRYVFPRFPFTLVYRSRPKVVEVIAIAHQRRKPRYWRAR
ncbi:MAG: type II toxin-antitoxin system RelE/ParE family toxin [Woeseia sp.]|nr:type II toxin-antitoxin system RelE/ParE family toxin [Woeseia sp.]